MKRFYFFFFALLTLNVQAFTEVECRGTQNGLNLRFEVERPFPAGSFYKDASLEISQDRNVERFDYQVRTFLNPGFKQVRYQAPDVNLEVDFFPDQRPEWGRTYFGRLRARALQNRPVHVNCRFMH